MSGTVPPPPPPRPAPQGPGGDPSRSPERQEQGRQAPPSFAPGGASARSAVSPSDAPGSASTQQTPPQEAWQTQPQEAWQTQPQYRHAPVPPAPAPAPTSPPAPAPAAATQVQPQGDGPAPQVPQRQPVFSVPPQQYGYMAPPQAYAAPAQPVAPPGALASRSGSGTAPNPAVARRRRLSPGWIAFIAIDTVLIVLVVVFAVNALREPVPQIAPQDDAVAAAPSESAAAPDDAEGVGESVAVFASPSRNITCEIFENGVTCGIAELDQQPAPVEDCDGSSGYAVALDGEGEVSLPCLDKSEKPKKAPKDSEQLPYGESRTEGDFTCESRQDGMRCTHDPSGSAFALARAGIGAA